jgi:predicted secreted hydrolase
MFKNRYRANVFVVLALLALLLAACGDSTATREAFPTPSANPAASQIAYTSPGPIPGAKLTFPLDEAPHDNITEWWYYTGHFTTTDGGRYGFEYVIFQGVRASFPVGYVSHFAVSDLNTKTFKYDQKMVVLQKKVTLGGNNGFNLALDNWTMQGLAGTDRLKATMTDGSFGLDLTVKDAKGMVLHGGGEFSYGPAGSSYYYSRPRMSVSGTLSVGGQAKEVKDGNVWFDHQWGNFMSLGGGWDWFSLYLDDNSEIMVYYIRDDKGNLFDLFGSYVPACAGACDRTGDKPARSVDLQGSDFNIQPTGQWTSPHNGGVYPSGWKVAIKAKGVPALELNVTPSILDQELDTSKTTHTTYWEGANTISGTKDGQPITGQAYVELTGYAKTRPATTP